MGQRPAVYVAGVGLLALLLGGCSKQTQPTAVLPATANSATGVLESALTAARDGDQGLLLACLAAPVATEDHPLRELLDQRALQGVSWHVSTVKTPDDSHVGAFAVEFSAPVQVGGKPYRHLFAWVMTDTAQNRATQFGAARMRPGTADPTGRWAVATSELKNFDVKTSSEYFSGLPQARDARGIEKLLGSD